MQDDVVARIYGNLRERDCLIQVLLGPRQVGKTTAAQKIKDRFGDGATYASADDVVSAGRDWILEKWLSGQNGKLLIIDEIQKIENWSETIKKLWDEQKQKKQKLKLLLLGSSSMQLHTGLSESLTGRFELHHLYQWSWSESQAIAKMTLDQYLKFGGYPGSYQFIKDPERWRNFLKNSIINTVIEKDILTNVRVKSPGLFRQSFELFMSFPAQEISYNKLLGQLQDSGNIDLIKYYLNIFEQAFLLKCIYKYSAKRLVTKSSSPKIIPMCPALSQFEGEFDETGRIFEAAVGVDLIKAFKKVSYWREASNEVDFVIEYEKKLYALEIKSGRMRPSKGLARFKELYPSAILKILDREDYSKFLSNPIVWLKGP